MFFVYKLSYKNYYYIGSTENFKKRLIEHKSDCFNQNYPGYNYKLYKKFRELGVTFNNFYDEIEYKLVCILNPNRNLNEYENMFINLENEFCLNKKRENQNRNNEDGSNNPEYDKEYNKKYRENNKEIIKKYQKKYRKKNKNIFICNICNKSFSSKGNLKRHFKSKKHLKNLK